MFIIGLTMAECPKNVAKISNWIFIILHGLLRQKPCMVKAACHLFETVFVLEALLFKLFQI